MLPRWLSWLGQLHDDYENTVGKDVRRITGSWRVGRRYATPLDRYLRSRGFRRLRSFAWRRGSEQDGWVVVQLFDHSQTWAPEHLSVEASSWPSGASRPRRWDMSPRVWPPQVVDCSDGDVARVGARLLELVRDGAIPWAESSPTEP